MNYNYVVRQPLDDADFSGWYCIKFVNGTHVRRKMPLKPTFRIPVDEAQPPVLRATSAGRFFWDYANKFMTPRDFHRAYPKIRLKPGEGPILVDLDDISTKRTARHPED